jgi:hypothetical protein
MDTKTLLLVRQKTGTASIAKAGVRRACCRAKRNTGNDALLAVFGWMRAQRRFFEKFTLPTAKLCRLSPCQSNLRHRNQGISPLLTEFVELQRKTQGVQKFLSDFSGFLQLSKPPNPHTQIPQMTKTYICRHSGGVFWVMWPRVLKLAESFSLALRL